MEVQDVKILYQAQDHKSMMGKAIIKSGHCVYDFGDRLETSNDVIDFYNFIKNRMSSRCRFDIVKYLDEIHKLYASRKLGKQVMLELIGLVDGWLAGRYIRRDYDAPIFDGLNHFVHSEIIASGGIDGLLLIQALAIRAKMISRFQFEGMTEDLARDQFNQIYADLEARPDTLNTDDSFYCTGCSIEYKKQAAGYNNYYCPKSGCRRELRRLI